MGGASSRCRCETRAQPSGPVDSRPAELPDTPLAGTGRPSKPAVCNLGHLGAAGSASPCSGGHRAGVPDNSFEAAATLTLDSSMRS